ncbi:nucleotidyltransferase domain-containing protein [Luteipulveratus flavus]|uniref:Nucleotidyltransferase domain-containing protein n=1 Tax=Luteipulveratus flavus TaxID=3031728 RepID=A0ABT6C3L1_9MICO|nr:nucleotidyltransferase domain-containing protein [Luteipulveratus sp. YIM 133296]MDF8262892.1 nucleotidyltransferase domain-containing protein [Luteipulveratus sp. YIM 133296]
MADAFPLTLEESAERARSLVQQRFPAAHAAYLGGSVVRGTATATSDLDVTVVLDGPPAPYRESLLDGDVPVELFVQTQESLRHFREQDQQRRQPSTARLVCESVVLLGDELAEALRAECAGEVAAGPEPLSQKEIDGQRYALTDLLDDLVGAVDPAERAVLGALVWERSARLLLGLERHWQGSGKGLLRELRAYGSGSPATEGTGASQGDILAARLSDLPGRADRTDDLVEVSGQVLDRCGGRLFAGYRLGGSSG